MEKECAEFNMFYCDDGDNALIDRIIEAGWEVLCRKKKNSRIQLWCVKRTVKVVECP